VTALTPVVLRIVGIDWGLHGIDIVMMLLFTGALIGFVEELLCRGIGVKMLRDGGHGEWQVAALSSLVFAFSHSVNLFQGQELGTVAALWVYTFAFGVLMYLTLRTSRFLVGAMIVHGLTDPTTILATGGIDEIKTGAAANGWLTAAGGVTLLLIVVGFVLLAFIRGRVGETPSADAAAEA
jgi:membrane protease YdiL (CAAX protease family)